MSGSGHSTIFFTAIFVAMGAGLAWYGFVLLRAARVHMAGGQASLAWPTAPGRVDASWVAQGTTQSSDPSLGASNTYTPVVAYSYAVAGQAFTGDRIAFRFLWGGEQAAKRIIERYPAGQAVSVAYDPAAPGSSVLEPGAQSGAAAMFWPAFLFVAALAIAAAGFLIPALGLL